MNGKKNSGGGELSYKRENKKKDLSEINCFSCHQFGHYATKCPNQKKGSKKDLVAASVETDEFSSHFQEFTLIACMASSMATSVWYIDNSVKFR